MTLKMFAVSVRLLLANIRKDQNMASSFSRQRKHYCGLNLKPAAYIRGLLARSWVLGCRMKQT